MSLSLPQDIGLIVIAATILAVLSGKFRQPLILGYVLAGVLIGPVLGLVQDPEPIKILSELGIAFLLFIIGLELDFNRLIKVGLKSSVIGLVQVVLTSAAGFFIAFFLGFTMVESAYIGLVISFSSTMIVAKMLGEQKELDSLHGELVLVILIIQDILAVLVLSLIGTGGDISLSSMPILFAKGAALLAVSYVLYRYALPFILKEAVNSTEVIFITALSTMFVFSLVAGFFGYSASIGAFVAGVALSTTKYNHEIIGRVKPLKDFFLVLFFVALGMQILFRGFASMLVPLLVLLAAVLIVKPIIVFFIAKWFGYSNRSSFFTGAQLAQVGEFSLVLAAQGIVVGHLQNSLFSMLIALTIITMVLTAYVIKYDDFLYNRFFADFIRRFGFIRESREKYTTMRRDLSGHIVIFGLHRMSEKIISSLRKTRKQFVVVDHNPEKAKLLAKRGITCICSDMSNPEIYEHVNIAKARVVISIVHNLASNTALIKRVKRENRKVVVMVASNDELEALRLYESGADFVIIPLILGGEKVVSYIQHLSPSRIAWWGRKYYAEIKSEYRPPVPVRHGTGRGNYAGRKRQKRRM